MIKGVFDRFFSNDERYELLNEENFLKEYGSKSVHKRYEQIEKLPFEKQLDILLELSASPSELQAFQRYISEPTISTAKENTKTRSIFGVSLRL